MDVRVLIIFIQCLSIGEASESSNDSTFCMEIMEKFPDQEYKTTWFEAHALCQQTGSKWMGFSDTLLSIENITPEHFEPWINRQHFVFWTGLYKPFKHVKKWFVSTGEQSIDLRNHTVFISEHVKNDGLCLAIKRARASKPILKLEDCSKHLSFFCNNNNKFSTMLTATNEEIVQGNFNGASKDNHSLVLKHCVMNCDKINDMCTGLPYDEPGRVSFSACKILKGNVTNISFVMNYTITTSNTMTSQGNITCEFITRNNQSSPLERFPKPKLNEIPLGYKICTVQFDNYSDFGQTFHEMIMKMEVNRHKTNRFLRQVTCAYDKRYSSKIMGCTAIALIVSVVLLLIIGDLSVPNAKPIPRRL